MAEVQKAALESYNKIKTERGEVTALDMFIAGRDWFKDQMMKDAEQIRFDCSLPCKTFNDLKARGIEIGDKLLIIKE